MLDKGSRRQNVCERCSDILSTHFTITEEHLQIWKAGVEQVISQLKQTLFHYQTVHRLFKSL